MVLFSLYRQPHSHTGHVGYDKYNHNYLGSGHPLFSSLQRESFLLHFAAHLSPLQCPTGRGCGCGWGCGFECGCGSKCGTRQGRATPPAPALPPAISLCAGHTVSMRHCPASLHRRFPQVSTVRNGPTVPKAYLLQLAAFKSTNKSNKCFY